MDIVNIAEVVRIAGQVPLMWNISFQCQMTDRMMLKISPIPAQYAMGIKAATWGRFYQKNPERLSVFSIPEPTTGLSNLMYTKVL